MFVTKLSALIAETTDDRVRYFLGRALAAACGSDNPVRQKRTYTFTDPDGVEHTYTQSYSDALRWVELSRCYTPSEAEMARALERRRTDFAIYVRGDAAAMERDAELHRLTILENAVKHAKWGVYRESKGKKAYPTGRNGYDAMGSCFNEHVVVPLTLVS